MKVLLVVMVLQVHQELQVVLVRLELQVHQVLAILVLHKFGI